MAKELFERIDRKVNSLLDEVLNGSIGLPDLQRPFVWQDTKVKELFDSMMRGFPIGYVMLWASPVNYENTKSIGSNEKQFKRPDDLVIDGQQRLTSLLAAMTGVPVKNKDFKEKRIKICYNPLTKEFFVWSQINENDTRLISDIAEVYKADENHAVPKLRKAVIKQINEGRVKNELDKLTDEEEELIESNINALLDLKQYTIPTLRILSTADEEDVAEIFRRVNSGGQNLNENNFIETLLAVYNNDLHDKIGKFCSESRVAASGTSYNQIIDIQPSHLIRMAVGLGFHRARLKYGYKLLRGKDLETGIVSEETRDKNISIFKSAIDNVTNLNNWHSFLNLFAEAGYLNKSLVASNYVVVFSYVLYLIGKNEYKVNPVELRKVITRWIFMSTVTSFYSSSPESTVERQLADLRSISDACGFVAYLNQTIKQRMNDSYFNVELINGLTSSSATSPVWFGYIASINVLGTPMLFSNTPLSKYWVLGSDGMKKAIDKHHIFPKQHLADIGIADDRDRNQLANFTYLDYNTNIDISDDAPALYVSRYKAKLGDDGYARACAENALPEGFESMSYFEFLEKRRVLMSGIIKKAYDKLWE